MELVAQRIPALVQSIEHHPDMIGDLMQVITSFLKKMKKHFYGQSISVEVIKSIPYFAKVANKTKNSLPNTSKEIFFVFFGLGFSQRRRMHHNLFVFG